MIKIKPNIISIGTKICIPESWINEISTQLDTVDYIPATYRVVDFIYNTYLCEGDLKETDSKNPQIWLSPAVVHYLLDHNVDDCNVGLHFSDYLPKENSKLILSNYDDNSVMAVQFKLFACLMNNQIYLSFVLENLLTSFNHTIESLEDFVWKYLYGSDTYMIDMEKMYQDTFIHKDYVMQVSNAFAQHLEEQGLFEKAQELRQRALVHDNSKIENNDEFIALTSIINDKKCLGNANVQLSPLKQSCIALHWKNNRHHPEYYQNYEEMSYIDRLEMVCDWMARSLQYKNDLIEFVETRQKQRFQFSETMYAEILDMCKTIATIYKNNTHD